MRILMLAAFLAATGLLSGDVFLPQPALAQSDEGGGDTREGEGSGCGHEKQEDTIS